MSTSLQIRNTQFDLSYSDDRLKAFLEAKVKQRGEALPTTGELRDVLLNHLAADSIHSDVLGTLLDQLRLHGEAKRRRVAQGTPAVQGKDARLVLLVKPYAGSKNIEHVTLRLNRMFDNIEPGMIVARLHAARPGIDGIDVRGNRLAATVGEVLTVQHDDSIRAETHSENIVNYIAMRSGYLESRGATLGIQSVLTINGDVDFHSGLIDFVGSVIVRGSVRKEFGVSARGDIEIIGDLDGGWLESEEGSVTVRGTVTGTHGTAITISDRISLGAVSRIGFGVEPREGIRAAGTIAAKIVSSSKLEAQGNIEILQEATTVSLDSRGAILAPNAHIRLAEITTDLGIDVSILGTPAGSQSKITVHPGGSSREMQRLEAELAEQTNALHLVQLSLGPLANDLQAVNALPETQHKKIKTLLESLERIEQSVAALQAQKEALPPAIETGTHVVAAIRGVVYAGVCFKLGESELVVADERIGKTSLYYSWDERRFEFGAFAPVIAKLGA